MNKYMQAPVDAQTTCVIVNRTHGQTQALINKIRRDYKEVIITNLEDENKIKALDIIVKEAHIKLGEMNGLYYFETSNTTYYISRKKYNLLKKALDKKRGGK